MTFFFERHVIGEIFNAVTRQRLTCQNMDICIVKNQQTCSSATRMNCSVKRLNYNKTLRNVLKSSNKLIVTVILTNFGHTHTHTQHGVYLLITTRQKTFEGESLKYHKQANTHTHTHTHTQTNRHTHTHKHTHTHTQAYLLIKW